LTAYKLPGGNRCSQDGGLGARHGFRLSLPSSSSRADKIGAQRDLSLHPASHRLLPIPFLQPAVLMLNLTDSQKFSVHRAYVNRVLSDGRRTDQASLPGELFNRMSGPVSWPPTTQHRNTYCRQKQRPLTRLQSIYLPTRSHLSSTYSSNIPTAYILQHLSPNTPDIPPFPLHPPTPICSFLLPITPKVGSRPSTSPDLSFSERSRSNRALAVQFTPLYCVSGLQVTPDSCEHTYTLMYTYTPMHLHTHTHTHTHRQACSFSRSLIIT
jgi:hypothetical protein